MGALPPIKRFLAEDFQSQAAWINNLLYPLNQLLGVIYSNLNRGLTLSQNMLAMTKVISVVGATPTTSFPWPFSTAPIGVSLISTKQTDGATSVITNAVTCDWSYTAGIISINNVTGLNAAHTYSCTFIVWGG